MTFYEALINPDRLWIWEKAGNKDLLIEFAGPVGSVWVVIQFSDNVLKDTYHAARTKPEEFDNYCRMMRISLPPEARRITKHEMNELLLKYVVN